MSSRKLTNSSLSSSTSSSSTSTSSLSSSSLSNNPNFMKRVSQFEQQQQNSNDQQKYSNDQKRSMEQRRNSSDQKHSMEQQRHSNVDQKHSNDQQQQNFIKIMFERFKQEFQESYPDQIITLPFNNLDNVQQVKQLLMEQKYHQQKLQQELNRCKFTIKFLEEIINHQEFKLIDDDNNNKTTPSSTPSTTTTSSQYVTVITLNDSAYGEIKKIQNLKKQNLKKQYSSLDNINNIDVQEQEQKTKKSSEPIYSNTLDSSTNQQKSTVVDKSKKRPPTPPRKPKFPQNKTNDLLNNKSLQQQNLKSTTTSTAEDRTKSPINNNSRSQIQRRFNGPIQIIQNQNSDKTIDKMIDNNRRFNKKSAATKTTSSSLDNNSKLFMRTFSLEQQQQQQQQQQHKFNKVKTKEQDKTNIYDIVAPDQNNGDATTDQNNDDDDYNNYYDNESIDERSIDERSTDDRSIDDKSIDDRSLDDRSIDNNNQQLSNDDDEIIEIENENENEINDEIMDEKTSSQEMLSRSSSIDELSSSNYVNIDYFLRKNSVGRSNSNIIKSNLNKFNNTNNKFEESENEVETLSSIKSTDYQNQNQFNGGSNDNLLRNFQSINNQEDFQKFKSNSSFRLQNSKSSFLQKKESINNLMSTFTPPSPSHNVKGFFRSIDHHNDDNLPPPPPPSTKLSKSTTSPTLDLETDFYAFTDIIHQQQQNNQNKETAKTSFDSFQNLLIMNQSCDDNKIINKSQTSPSTTSTTSSKSNNNISINSFIDDDDDGKRQQSEQMQWNIIRSIIDSETIYIDCLNTMNKYRKAFESSINNSGDNVLISKDDIETIFYRINDIYDIHITFLNGLKTIEQGFKLRHSQMSESKFIQKQQSIGELFNYLAEQLPVYADFLRNYSKAIDTANRCSANNERFFKIIKSIKLASTHVQFSNLMDMLHEPVARLQKNALVLHDLLKYLTADQENDQRLIKNALRLNQKFLNDLNLDAARRLFMTHDKFKRRLVKESFIIESGNNGSGNGGGGNNRKLRHLFLFNDVIVSAKYKASSKQKFTFELRWFQMLNDLQLDNNNPIASSSSSETFLPLSHHSPNSTNSTNQQQQELEKETKDLQTTANLITNLKSRAYSTRLDLYLEERRKNQRSRKQLDRLRKKLSELESELSLYLPQLKFSFRLKSPVNTSNHNKCYTFFLSSEYERNCWIDAIRTLQQNQLSTSSDHEQVNVQVLQKWIESCRKSINVNCGSFLLRSNKDETLRYGDLQIRFIDLGNFHYHTDLFIVIETDSFGHYFKRAVARYLQRDFKQQHHKNRCQEFLIELEGSQIVRFLLYEIMINDNDNNNDCNRIINNLNNQQLKGKAIFELTASCINTEPKISEIQIGDYTLCFETRFIPWNAIMETIPPNKIYGAFGVSINQVCKKEKSQIPYLIMSCILEVERRGLREVGIYRVSGPKSEVQKLKKAFETNPRDACFLIREIDIHVVTGLLKLYLRELPESLFTNDMYQKYFEARNLKNFNEKELKMTTLLSQLMEPNQSTVIKLIEHLVFVNHFEDDNKMSLNNLATVFGPTMLRTNSSSNSTNSTTNNSSTAASSNNKNSTASTPTPNNNNPVMSFTTSNNNHHHQLHQPNLTPLIINTDLFTASTIDVMAQADILYFFLRRKADGLSLISIDHDQEETSL